MSNETGFVDPVGDRQSRQAAGQDAERRGGNISEGELEQVIHGFWYL